VSADAEGQDVPDEPKPEEEPWPEVDPDALKKGSFIVGEIQGGQFAVTARDGEVQKRGVPAKLFSSLTEKVAAAVEGAGNLAFSPYVLQAMPGASMTIVFGESEPLDDQMQILHPQVWEASVKIAKLIRLSDAELFASARRLGRGARAYVELANFVQSEGVTLDWEPVGVERRTLTPTWAGRQYADLTRPPQIQTREMEITGLLSRAIWEGPGQGKAGIRLSPSSPRPPHRQGSFVVVIYEDLKIEEQILHHLLGRTVRAVLRIEEPDPATSLFAEARPAVVIAIEPAELAEPMLFKPDEDMKDDQFS
jgi:hypothetical protein